MTTKDVTVDTSWQTRPWLSAAVRVAAYGTPVALGSVAVRLVSGPLLAAMPRVVAVLLSLLCAAAVSLAVSRATMRLVPLAVLLKMTMIFPDKAPSRLKVARRATSMRDITARLASPDMSESEAAATMLSLVTALGRHDRHTRGHSERVRLFCDLLARQLDLSAADAGRLRWAALIHDIGKLEVAATILNKPGKLDAREWTAIKAHPEAGAALAAPLAAWLGPWFNGIPEHHERFDGTGYPRGLAGSQISPAGRAVAVVDAFETMTAARSYKAARSTLSARAELTRCAGTHFDPSMVRAFLHIALPRLLWSVGPLAFLVNLPYLRWVGEGSVRIADAAAAASAGATGAAGVTAVAVAVGTMPAVGAHVPPPPSAHSVVVSPAAIGTLAKRVAFDRDIVSSIRTGGTSTTGGSGSSGSGSSGSGSSGSGSSGSGSGSSGSGSSGSSGSGSGAVSAVGSTVGGAVGAVTDGTPSGAVGSTVSSLGNTVGGALGGLTGGTSDPSAGASTTSSGSSGSGSSGSHHSRRHRKAKAKGGSHTAAASTSSGSSASSGSSGSSGSAGSGSGGAGSSASSGSSSGSGSASVSNTLCTLTGHLLLGCNGKH